MVGIPLGAGGTDTVGACVAEGVERESVEGDPPPHPIANPKTEVRVGIRTSFSTKLALLLTVYLKESSSFPAARFCWLKVEDCLTSRFHRVIGEAIGSDWICIPTHG